MYMTNTPQSNYVDAHSFGRDLYWSQVFDRSDADRVGGVPGIEVELPEEMPQTETYLLLN